MERYCQLIGLRPEDREEYILQHREVWPSVLSTIAACNIRNYSIYLHEELLIATFEYHGVDYEADMRRMAADPETQRWWRIMDPMQTPLSGATPDRRWVRAPEVFHFEAEDR